MKPSPSLPQRVKRILPTERRERKTRAPDLPSQTFKMGDAISHGYRRKQTASVDARLHHLEEPLRTFHAGGAAGPVSVRVRALPRRRHAGAGRSGISLFARSIFRLERGSGNLDARA